jgi:putative endonuclease
LHVDDGIVVSVWFVYILRCSNGSLYVGETNNVEQRVADHNRGRGSAHTAKHRPVEAVYVEQHSDRPASLKREQQLKRWTRVKKQALIDGDKVALKRA